MATSLNTSRPVKTQEVNYAPRVRTITASETLTNGSDGQTILLDAAAGLTVTLPAAVGSGWKAKFIVKTTVTSNNDVIQVANATDVMTGVAILGQDAADTVVLFETASTSDTITMNGSTKGGILGDCIEIEDIASGLFYVRMIGSATGTEATPFSAAVS